MNKIIINNNIIDNIKNSSLTIIENKITFTKDGNYIIDITNSNNITIEIKINSNININLLIWSKNNNNNSNIKYILDANSTINIQEFNYNKNALENITVDLNGNNSKYIHKLSSICKNVEEYNITINHNNNNVKSYLINKCISHDKSNIKFNINSILNKGNIDCIMDQTTKILNLGDAQTSINPNMFIEEDSVEARHGSVISSFNQDDIFYLMSRGISKKEAIKLLSIGFIMSNINVSKEKQKEIIECI